MMVNCPKCQLLQPKDQYCANCGINMETWKPPSDPLWKRSLSNWMVQLAVLMILVLLVVLRDNFRDRSPDDEQESLGPRVPVAAPLRTAEPENWQSPTDAESLTQAAQGDAQAGQAPARQEKSNPEAPAAKPWQQQASVRSLLINRPLIESISQTGQRLGSTAFLLPRQEFENLLARRRADFQVGGATNQVFQWESPISFFIGEEDLETGVSLGFFVKARINRANPGQSLRVDLRQWSQLQLSGEIGPQTLIDASLNKENLLFIVDLSAHDNEFTGEERSLFESSSRLRLLNEANFVEGLAEIALVFSVD